MHKWILGGMCHVCVCSHAISTTMSALCMHRAGMLVWIRIRKVQAYVSQHDQQRHASMSILVRVILSVSVCVSEIGFMGKCIIRLSRDCSANTVCSICQFFAPACALFRERREVALERARARSCAYIMCAGARTRIYVCVCARVRACN